uniref:Zinc finger CCHC domain-containing protein 4 n=1 Tax=Lygus hesperus TaxID=30085 RepID=A0A146MBW8_LYGHE
MSTLQVDCTNLHSNPSCPHGPMVKFIKSIQGNPQEYFACTACRNPKDCPFSLKCGEKFSAVKIRALSDAKRQMAPKLSHVEASELLFKFKKLSVRKRDFCRSCFVFVFPDSANLHSGHNIVHKVTDDMLTHPSQFVLAKTNDKVEAQYWFNDETKQFILSLVEQLESSSVLCIGTPTVYEMVRSTGIRCLLLDIDSRYMTFYSNEEFGWFNMLNFHFLSDESVVLDSLKKTITTGRVFVILDPPFGARLELLAYSINRLSTMCSGECMIFLVLPYFMEPHVTKYLPDFHMLDYVVHYANHSKMKSHKKSAVRLFTNVSSSSIHLPASEGYKFCGKCRCWRHPNNSHCDVCGTCPAKNATAYKHCTSCNVCVKSTWDHCDTCGRCFLSPHKCFENPPSKRAKIADS